MSSGSHNSAPKVGWDPIDHEDELGRRGYPDAQIFPDDDAVITGNYTHRDTLPTRVRAETPTTPITFPAEAAALGGLEGLIAQE